MGDVEVLHDNSGKQSVVKDAAAAATVWLSQHDEVEHEPAEQTETPDQELKVDEAEARVRLTTIHEVRRKVTCRNVGMRYDTKAKLYIFSEYVRLDKRWMRTLWP